MGRARLLVIGNTVLDLVGKTPDDPPRFGELAAGRGPANMDIGGNGARAAATATVLGADTRLASSVGDDAWGGWLKERLRELGVDLSQVATVAGESTATTVSLVRSDGERALLTHNGASDHHDLGSVDLSDVGEGWWVLVGSLFLVPRYGGEPLVRLVREARDRGARVALDFAWDCTGEWSLDRIPVGDVDLILGNEMEIKAVACTTDLDAAIDHLTDNGVDTLVVKLGSHGTVATRRGTGERLRVPAPEVEPLNATGTGDVFNAALLVALGQGRDLDDALRFACGAGALRVARGCMSFPRAEEIEELLARGA